MRRLLLATVALALTAPALADTLVDNVDGLTIDATGGVERFTGLLIGDDGRIVHVLHRGDKRPGKVDYFVDGKGQVLVPGMIDSHGHVMGLGFSALTLDLTETRSLAEALAKVAAYAKANPDRPWILGRGWNQELWPEKRFPTAAELDAVVGDRPVWLERVDGHAGWANSKALAAAGVTLGTDYPLPVVAHDEARERTRSAITSPDCHTPRVTPSRRSWSTAAARNVSAAPSTTAWPSRRNFFASLPTEVVLPTPLRPSIPKTWPAPRWPDISRMTTVSA